MTPYFEFRQMTPSEWYIYHNNKYAGALLYSPSEKWLFAPHTAFTSNLSMLMEITNKISSLNEEH